MKKTASPIVATIVLTWNSADCIEECLQSLLDSTLTANVLVVDNDSSDTTREVVATKFPTVALINSGDNLGYAGGNNFGIRHLGKDLPEYLFVLNPDAKVAPDCIEKLVQRMNADQKLAGISPMIYYHDSTQIWYGGSNINWTTGDTSHIGWNEQDAGQYRNSKLTQRLSGCAMLLRSSAVQKVGLMDENYFLYFEETDWSVRFARIGYKLGFEPMAHVWHQTSSSTGGYKSATYQYYMTRNQLYLMRKFKPEDAAAFYKSSIQASRRELLKVLLRLGPRTYQVILAARRKARRDYQQGKFGRRPTG